jgi:hypothetical protein
MLDPDIQKLAALYPSSSYNNSKNCTTSGKKWLVSLLVAFLFILFASAWIYKGANKLLGKYVSFLTPNGCPSLIGISIISIIVLIITRLLLW